MNLSSTSFKAEGISNSKIWPGAAYENTLNYSQDSEDDVKLKLQAI